MFHISAVIMLAMATVPESTCSPASGSPAAAPAAASVVPFEPRQASQIIVPLYLDGTGPWRFLVDTGSGRSAISGALAAKIGAPLVAHTEPAAGQPGDGSGASAASGRPVARLTNLTVGCARAQALLAPTLSQAELRQLGADVVGVLGQDFLSRFSYTLDYRANRLVWELADGEGDAAEVATDPRRVRRVRLPLIEEEDGRFVVDLSGTRFVPTSAIDSVVLFGGAGTNQFLANAAAQPGELLPVDNRRAARQVMLKRLQIGTAALWNVPAVVMFGPNGTEAVPNRDGDANADDDGDIDDGLLPLSIFARVRFNPRLGYMEVEPQ